jgi:hypothetical protein
MPETHACFTKSGQEPELTTKRDPIEACIAALAGAVGPSIHEGKRRAPFREVGRLKALTGHGETTHLLQRIDGKTGRWLNDLTAKVWV